MFSDLYRLGVHVGIVYEAVWISIGSSTQLFWTKYAMAILAVTLCTFGVDV